MAEALPFLKTYADEAARRLEAIAGRALTQAERDKIDQIAAERCDDQMVAIVNPHFNVRSTTSIGRIAGWIKNRKPMPAIVTGHGTIFKPHDEFKSTVGEMVDFLMKTRKVAKNQMFDLMREGRSPDDPEVKALDQRQKIFKLLANSFYGAYGEKGFHFYDQALGPAVTYTGQLIISSTLFGFESFMSNNLWLRDEDDMARHVALCLIQCEGADPQDEWGEHPGLIEAVDAEYVVGRLVDAAAPGWDSESYARQLVEGLGPNELLALALRGDPYTFMTFPKTYELLAVALSGEIREADPGKLKDHHPEGKAAMEQLWQGLKKWVAVSWMPPDMPRMVGEMKRRVVILTDTDSTFLNLHPWMNWLKENCEMADAEEDKLLTGMNVMVYLLRLMNDDQMAALTENLGVPEHKRRLINFKSEFVISRMVLTNGKKHYTALLKYQEGARIVGDKVELKGLAMKKTTTAKTTGTHFEKSIETRVLRAAEVDRVGLVRDVVTLEDRIRTSIASGEPTYSSPSVLGRMSEYADMYAMPVVRGTIAWNTVEVNNPIREGDRVNMFHLNVGTDVSRLTDEIAKFSEGGETYQALHRLMDEFFGHAAPEGLSKNGLNWIAVPKDVSTLPAWVLDLIDKESVLAANTSVIHPLLEAVGVRVIERPEPAVYSNCIRF